MARRKGRSEKARKTWGEVAPVTRRIESAKQYRRTRDKRVTDHEWD